MAAPKGFRPPNAGKGRPKGASNKTTIDLRNALMEPFDPVRFAKWAKDNENQYYTLIVTKLLPKDINLSAEFTVTHTLAGMKARLEDQSAACAKEIKAILINEPQDVDDDCPQTH